MKTFLLDFFGYLGSLMAVTFPALSVLKDWMQITGAALGIIIAVLTIQIKRIQKRNEINKGKHFQK